MIVVVDGNDGTGKSTLVAALRTRGYAARDRGAPTRMVDEPDAGPNDGEVYLVLDAPVEVSRERLARAGKDLEKRYHTVADLVLYRERFREVAARLVRCAVVDARGTPAETLALSLEALEGLGLPGEPRADEE